MEKPTSSPSRSAFLHNLIMSFSPKVVDFVWETSWDNALTLDNVHKRGILSVNRGSLCISIDKTIDHLLISL